MEQYKTIAMKEDTCKKCGSELDIVDVEFFPEENNYQPIFGCHCDDAEVCLDESGAVYYPNLLEDELPF